jgi:hypothetical protein
VNSRRADLAYFAGLAVAITALVVLGLLQLRIDKLGADDFSRIWTGPRAFLEGADPYDAATWLETAVRIGAYPPDTAVYLYPPWVILALLPFALLPANAAGAVWTVIGIVAAVVAVRALLRAYLPDLDWAHGVIGLVLVISAPATVTFLTGQWTFIFVAALVTIVLCLRARRPVAAGLLAVVMLVKAPLFVFTASALAVRALWPSGADPRTGRRFVLVGMAAGIATIATSWLIVPSWWPAWLDHVAAVQVAIEPVTIQTLFIRLFGSNGGWVAAPVLLGMVVAALQFDPRSDGWLPVWFALSSAGVVYSNTYDLLLLVVPIVLAAGALASRRRAALVVIAGAVLLLIVMWYLHTTDVRGYAAGVALLAFVIITAALWPERREVAALRG